MKTSPSRRTFVIIGDLRQVSPEMIAERGRRYLEMFDMDRFTDRPVFRLKEPRAVATIAIARAILRSACIEKCHLLACTVRCPLSGLHGVVSKVEETPRMRCWHRASLSFSARFEASRTNSEASTASAGINWSNPSALKLRDLLPRGGSFRCLRSPSDRSCSLRYGLGTRPTSGNIR